MRIRSLSLICIGLLLACGEPGPGEDCASSDQDGDPGRCEKDLLCYHSAEGAKVCMSQEAADEQCKNTSSCRESGACHYSSDLMKCNPTTKGDCQQSDKCAQDGQCSIKDLTCWVTSDDDCARAFACKTDGKCKAGSGDTENSCVKG